MQLINEDTGHIVSVKFHDFDGNIYVESGESSIDGIIYAEDLNDWYVI